MELFISLGPLLLVLAVTQIGQVQANIFCNSYTPPRFGPVCPFDCSNCGGVTCDYDYKCVGGYCASANGPAGPQGCAFEDISRGKTMAQISKLDGLGPYRAANRYYATDEFARCTHTLGSARYPWWRVDFRSQHVVYAVQLYNRISDVALDRLSFFDIRVGDTDMSTITAGQKFNGNTLCRKYNQRVPETLSDSIKPYAEILCDQPVRGRYLSIQMNEGGGISRSQGYTNVLTICEINVRGYIDSGPGGRNGDGDCWCRDANECDMAGVCNSGCKLGWYEKYCHRVIDLEVPTLSARLPTSVNVQWKLFNSNQLAFIDSNRGSVDLSYRVQYKPVDGTTWQDFFGQSSVSGSGATQVRVLALTGLQADTRYYIRSALMKTHNGNTEMAAHSSEVTRCAVPAPVTNIELTTECDGADRATITVTWQASSFLRCGTGSVQYVVWVKEGPVGSGTFGSHGLQNSDYVKRNLKRATLYTVRVEARNSAHHGLKSLTDQTLTTTNGLPSAPEDVQLSTSFSTTTGTWPNQARIRVTWKRPVNAGCGPVWYRVTYGRLGDTATDMNIPSTSHTLLNLVPYTWYEVTVTIVSGVKTADAGKKTIRTAEGQPGRVSSLTITPSSNSAVLSWSAPTPHGILSQYEIAYRRVRYLAGCQSTDQTKTRTVAAAVTTYTVTGLTSYSEYQFSVTAYTNNNGNKGLTEWQTKQTTKKAPPRPSITNILLKYEPTFTYPNTVRTTVAWSQPAADAGECMTVTNYIHYRRSGTSQSAAVTPMTSRPFEIPRLVPYTEYDVRVEARSKQGLSSFTEWKQHRTAEGLSGPVTALSASPSATSMDVGWGAPAHPYGLTTSYRVSFSRESYLAGCANNPGHSGVVDTTNLTSSFTGLSPFSRYLVTVAAINGAGPGKETSQDVNTTDTGPDPSAIPSETGVKDVLAESALVQFHDVSCEQKRGLFKQYNYQLSDLSYGLFSRSERVVANQLSLSDLIPLTNYSIRYNWENQKGASVWSSDVFFMTPKSVPPAPSLDTDSGLTFITVSVTPPYPPHDYLTAVSVTCTVDNDATLTVHRDMAISENSNTSVAVPFFESEVQPSSRYLCWAVVKSESRTSDKSTQSDVFTLDGEPSAPRRLQAVEVTMSSVRLIWTSPMKKSGIISKYQYWCKAEQTKNPSMKGSLSTAPKLEFSVDRQYRPVDWEMSHSPEPIAGLWSATEYQCQVRAVNGWGEGKATSTAFWTKAEKIDPVDARLTYDGGKSDDDSVHLILPRISSTVVEIERYRVAVELTETVRRKRSTIGSLTFAEARDTGSNSYIAAEWTSYRETFVVGDGSNNNGYYNAPLTTGETYIISYGVASVVDGVADFVYVKTDRPIKAGHYSDGTHLELLPYIAAGVGAALAIAVAIIAAVVVCRCRKRKQESGQLMSGTYEMETGAVNEAAEYAEVVEPPSSAPETVPPVKRYAGSARGYDPQTLLHIVEELTISRRGFTKEFQGLSPNELSKDAATRQQNKQKNRPGGVLPFDHSRVKLGECDVAERGDTADYINASWIEDFTGRRRYIATQAPLTEGTEADFWSLVWDKEVKVIVMLTAHSREEEGLCAQYWPAKAGEVVIFAGMNIVLHAEQTISPGIFKRDLVVIKGGISRNITQFHYAGWPEQGVPALCAPLLKLRAAVREILPRDSLTLVHCSYGTGRTGTFIAVDDILCQHHELGTFNVKDTIQRLLHCRDKLIDSDRQYTFVHHCVLESLHLGDTEIPKAELLEKRQPNDSHKMEYKIMDLMRQVRFETDSVGAARPHQDKNRDPTIIPEDLYRPTLKTQRRDQCYINACFVKNLTGSPELLVTQLPLANTVTDFWQLVWDQEINTIVRLDDNKRRMKAGEQYWPTRDRTDTGAFTITFDRRDSTNTAYTVETFKLSQGNSSPRTVRVLVFHAWPDSSPTPEFPLSFLHLYRALKNYAAEAPTALVQCYDGATKSGLMCATYCLLEALAAKESVSVYQVVRQTQQSRPQFIPDMRQYTFLHAVVCEFMEQAAEDIYTAYMEPVNIQQPDDYINFSQA